MKKFPEDFFTNDARQEYYLHGKSLLIGKKFFGEYELIDVEGSEILRIESYDKAMYFLYVNRNTPKNISTPNHSQQIKEKVRRYEKHLDSIVKKIEKDYHAKFPAAKIFSEVLKQIFFRLNLIRL